MRRNLNGSNDGDRQMVAILAAVLADGLASVEAACGDRAKVERRRTRAPHAVAELGEAVILLDVEVVIVGERRETQSHQGH